MNSAVLEELKRLAHPVPFRPDGSCTRYAWFSGSVEQARQCTLLQGVGVPGDPGKPKTSLKFTLNDGRRVHVRRYVRSGVTVRIDSTDAEREAAKALKDAAPMHRSVHHPNVRYEPRPDPALVERLYGPGNGVYLDANEARAAQYTAKLLHRIRVTTALIVAGQKWSHCGR